MRRNSVHSGDSTMMFEYILKGNWKTATAELRKSFPEIQLMEYFNAALAQELEAPRKLFASIVNVQAGLVSQDFNLELVNFLKTIANKLNTQAMVKLSALVEKNYPLVSIQQKASVPEPAEHKEEVRAQTPKKLSSPQKEFQAQVSSPPKPEDLTAMWALLNAKVATSEKEKRPATPIPPKSGGTLSRRSSYAPAPLQAFGSSVNSSASKPASTLLRRASISAMVQTAAKPATTAAPTLSRSMSISGMVQTAAKPAIKRPASTLLRAGSVFGLDQSALSIPAPKRPAPSAPTLSRASVSGPEQTAASTASNPLKRPSVSGLKQAAPSNPAATLSRRASISGLVNNSVFPPAPKLSSTTAPALTPMKKF